ncbi:hypothetical protein SAMN05216559_3971 [Halomicrobium zhouii]|uniref:PGF-CTERM protein n=1 Tax=Halomicrobium zhouii TaxID=767519 RepID=A0A1I6M888_9EURY|nr:hypothetical protein [Halomicrobium zhouii]SFS11909.1 hypothetical protein SAMN05216559_3971 [Halomicrobium zhouii]
MKLVHGVARSSLPRRLLVLALCTVCLVASLSVAPVSATGAGDSGDVAVYSTTETDLDNATAVHTGITSGSILPTERMVAGETLVVVVDSKRLATDLDAGAGSPTARFFDALDGEAGFRIVQTNMDSHSPPKVPRLGPENVTIYRNGATTYFLVDTGVLEFPQYLAGKDKYEPAGLQDGDRFAVEFGYGLGEVPFHGASKYEPAGPAVTLYTAESGLPETPTESATAAQTATPGETETAPPVDSRTNETEERTPYATGEDGAGFTLTAASAALILLAAAVARRQSG